MKKNSIFAAMLCGGLFLTAPSAMAQNKTVKLTTSQAVGTSVSLLVNNDANKITVDWGDGEVVTYQADAKNSVFKIEGTVKGSVISVSSNANWNMLGCANCGITDIDLSQAKDLRSLYCRNNEIKALDLRGMTRLVDLDCSYNKIERLRFTSNVAAQNDLSSIENLNLSHNSLKGSYNLTLPTLQNLNISSNKYTNIRINDAEVRSLNCADNQFRGSLNLRRLEKLNTLVCHGNQFTSLTLNDSLADFRQLVCDNNKLSTLDLSTANQLTDLSCSNNKLSNITIGKYKDLSSMNVSGNELSFGVLPVPNNKPQYMSFEPQNPFSLKDAEGLMKKEGIPYIPVSASWSDKSLVMLKPYICLEGSRYSADCTWFSIEPDGTEKELTRRSSASGTEDYYLVSGQCAFFTPHKKAYLHLKSKQYGYEIKSQPIAIGDDVTGVEQVVYNGNVQISVVAGTIVIDAAAPTAVNIYTVAGKKVWSKVVNGTENVTLPNGVYVVNGKKLIL